MVLGPVTTTVDPTATSTATLDSSTSHTSRGSWIGNVPATTNKSCDYCSVRKRRCDGDGISRCSRCQKRGAGHECTYSKRKPHRPRRIQPDEAAGRAAWAALQGAAHANVPPEECGGRVVGALLRCGVQSFKRYRLSASPATGLVGTKENTLLSDYFGCVGFLPLASQSDIRETMVRIMTARVMIPSEQQRPGFEYLDIGEKEDCDGVVVGPGGGAQATWNGSSNGDGEKASSSGENDAASCIFWCAVGVGGLVQGAPVESVARYVDLAKKASERFSGPPSAERAKAWTMLGYLYAFIGDLDQFHACLQRADEFLQASAGGGSLDEVPVGLVETVKHSETIKLFSGDMDRSEVESFCSEERPPPQISEAATEAEIYQFVMQSYRGFEQAFYGDVCAEYHSRADDAMDQGEAGGCDETDTDEGASSVDSSSRAVVSQTELGSIHHAGMLGTIVTRLKDHSCGFERLESAVERPHIRAGVGGLIINGTLVFTKAVKKDFQGVTERMSRCIEVFERYPGLCRYAMGSHIAHIMISVLASMESPGTRQLYEKLRAAYNPMRSASSGPIPPFEEWQGVDGICDHLYCRSMEKLADSDEIAFSSRRFECRSPCDIESNAERDGDGEDCPGIVLAAQVNLSGGGVPGVAQDPGISTMQGLQTMSLLRHPEGRAGEDTTGTGAQPSDDLGLSTSAGTEEEILAGWLANFATETGYGFAQIPVATDVTSTRNVGPHTAAMVGLDSSVGSDVDVGGDVVAGDDDGSGSTTADRVSDIDSDIFALTGSEDAGAATDDIEEDFSAADWLAVTHAMLDKQAGSGPGFE